MEHIRRAQPSDAPRIAEIRVFNYRLQFYPIFRDDDFYFREMTVAAVTESLRGDAAALASYYVYDDGIVRGMMQAADGELVRLFVEPVFQGRGIGAKLLEYAVNHLHAERLWVLEKNPRAIRFYERHGFRLTDTKQPGEDTDEYLLLMRYGGECDAGSILS